MERMSQKIHGYELLVEQLKDELREEKAKAKEEAEDLTQEKAELRYQITGMLEEECKRCARIEQASLQRIAELEAQVIINTSRLIFLSRLREDLENLADVILLESVQKLNIL